MSKKTKIIIGVIAALVFFLLGLWCGIRIDRVSVWVGQKLVPALVCVFLMLLLALIFRAKIRENKKAKEQEKLAAEEAEAEAEASGDDAGEDE